MDNESISKEKTVVLTGDLTVARADELKEMLIQALAASDLVRIRLKAVSAVDLSCLQLLCSAHRTASALSKQLCLVGERPEAVLEIIAQSGFRRQKGCSFSMDNQCFWSGGQG